ncbi:Zn-dependent hydrolase [Ignatzschineria sp. LJL83]
MKVNQDRLWNSLMEMAKIGATPKGGSSRLALSKEDKEGRELFVSWCEALRMEMQRDPIGNLFAIYPGMDREAPSIMMGSHLDTQPKGGRFDGVYGVLGALEVVRIMHENGMKPHRDIEIAVWMNEEGARFSPAMLGSEVFIGSLPLEDALGIEDVDGIAIQDALREVGEEGSMEFQRVLDSYFELHIEQGPILEDLEKEIGIVTGGQAIAWLDGKMVGRAQHAGTTPMRYRKDAMFAVSDFLVQIEAYVASIENALLTVGEIGIPHSSRNTIAGTVHFTLDVRHPETAKVEEMVVRIKEIANEVEERRHLELGLEDVWLSPAIPFDDVCIDLVRGSVADLNLSSIEMISGAGHDAIHLAKHCPTTMIFIACKDGISHNEAESITERDAVNGANVLLHAVLKRNQLLS